MLLKFCLIFGTMAGPILLTCCGGHASDIATSKPTPSVAAQTPTPDDDPKGEFLTSETGTPRAVPKPGKANIQGKVFYNLEPVPNIEIKLCVTPNMFADCIGEKHTAKTDASGEYLFTDLEPRTYGGLFVRVFNTKDYVFTGRYGFAQKINAKADETFFVPLTSLFKGDLKVLNPKRDGKVDGANVEISWESYAGAGYYILELMQFGKGNVYHLTNERSNGTSYKVAKRLPDGQYRLRIEAFNPAGVKIAQAGNGIQFSVVN